jgi:hypothetical protein
VKQLDCDLADALERDSFVLLDGEGMLGRLDLDHRPLADRPRVHVFRLSVEEP